MSRPTYIRNQIRTRCGGFWASAAATWPGGPISARPMHVQSCHRSTHASSIGLSCPIVIKESFQNLLSKKYYLKSYLNKNYFISLYSSNFLESHSRFLCLASEKFKIERMFIFKNLIKQTIGGYFFNKISIPIK